MDRVTQRDVAEDPGTTRTVDTDESGSAETGRRLPRTGRAESPAGRVRARQRDEFGGVNWGAAFFGWLVAIGIGVVLTALLSAAGAAIGLTSISTSAARSNAAAIGIGGGILLTLVAAISYFAGGYVAGRMSRFDGGRQGFATWIWGLIATVLLAVLGLIAGSQYNVFGGLDLPRIPVDEGTLTTGGAITLGAVVIASLLAAIAGGKAGERYHRRVDEAGFSDRAEEVRAEPAPAS
jgi:hypothetical protein